MDYGVIYMKFVPKGKPSWIKYCHLFGALPEDLKDGIKKIVFSINYEYKDNLVIPMNVDAHPGCIVKSCSVDKIAETIYGMGSVLLNKLNVDPFVRVIYSIGEIRNVNIGSIHQVANDDVMVKVGHYLDESDEPGIFGI